MPRHYPDELHIGQKVLVRPNSLSHAVEAVITGIDDERGIVRVQPLGYAIQWAARPRAISSPGGLYLHFENRRFFYSTQPCHS